MAQNYTRQSSFNDGDTISASLFNDEYNQLVNSFSYSSSSESGTGHRHDGSAGQGGNIYRIGDLDFFNKIEADSANNRWGFWVEVGGSAVEQVRIQDGAVLPVTTNDIDLGSGSLEFKDLHLSGSASFVGASTTADITFADNSKAIFGAGSDLQIYHDGSNSYIDDAGTGALQIRSNGLYLQKYTNENMIRALADGAVSLYYDNAIKLDTTATGIDVTGTVTADGLTVDGSSSGRVTSAEFKNNLNAGGTEVAINLANQGGTSNADVNLVANRVGANFGSDFYIETSDGVDGTNRKRFNIGENGDISFYEDTGTTAKFFWDASAEALGIGTTSPVGRLDVSGGADGTIGSITLAQGNTTSKIAKIYGTSVNTNEKGIRLNTFHYGDVDAVTITSDGNVGIGTSSPGVKLQIDDDADFSVALSKRASTTSALKFTLSDPAITSFTWKIEHDSNENLSIYGYSADDFIISTNATERMRIDSSGNVGIGTASPSEQLHIANANDAVILVESTGTDATDDANIQLKTTNGTFTIQNDRSIGTSGALTFAGNTSNNIVIDHNSGNVGIGTSSPDTLMELRAANPVLTIRDTETSTASNDARLRLAETGVSDALGNYYDIGYIQGNLQFRYNTSEYMRIDSSGNLLVGKTSLYSTDQGIHLDPDGTVYGTRPNNASGVFNRKTSDGNIVIFEKDGTTVGSIGIETTGFYVDGEAGHTGLKFRGFDILPRDNGADVDGTVSLGGSASRFGDLYLSGGLPGTAAGALVINENGVDSDFRVESDTNTHALYLDAASSKVGINNSAPTGHLAINGLQISVLSRAYTMSTTPVEVLQLDNQGNSPVFIRVYRKDTSSPQGSELIELYIACSGSGTNITSVTLVQDDKVQIGSIHNVTFTAAVVSNNAHISITGDDNGGESQSLVFEVHHVEGYASIL